MSVEKIDAYTKRTSAGKLVQVKAHERQNTDVGIAAVEMPGRPPMAGKPGMFANGRSTPGVWLDPDRKFKMVKSLDALKTEDTKDRPSKLSTTITSPTSDKTKATLSKVKMLDDKKKVKKK